MSSKEEKLLFYINSAVELKERAVQLKEKLNLINKKKDKGSKLEQFYLLLTFLREEGTWFDGNPPVAIVFENDSKVYFVAETKDTTDINHLREEERQKIKCGIKHFEQIEGVEFAGPIEKLTDIKI